MLRIHIKQKFLTRTIYFYFAFFISLEALAGFRVSGTQLLDANDKPFIMRGINHPHAWYIDKTTSFADIATTGANTVRVVLSDGQQWRRNSAKEVKELIRLCKTNKLVCVLEVHDVTGSGDKAEAGSLAKAVKYWLDIKSVLIGEEDYVIINIANEPFGNNVPANEWIEGHRKAIVSLRNAGLTHALLVDAPSWGQDWQEIMLDSASKVASVDPSANTFFSVHMYEVYQNLSKIEGYVSRFLKDQKLPLIVGEFGGEHNGKPVDEDSILAVSEKYGIGYLVWSWSGNSDCCVNLDMVKNFNANSLTSWGERVINGVNGIRQTSLRASVYEDNSALSLAPSPMLATTGTLVEVKNFGENPGNLAMHLYVPKGVTQDMPVLFAVHYCTGDGPTFFRNTQYAKLAEQYGFIVIYPTAIRESKCFDVYSPEALSGKGSDPVSLISMLKFVQDNYRVDDQRIFVTGVSSGAMMTNVMLALYPHIFNAGAAFAGVPYACFATDGRSQWNNECSTGKISYTDREWGNLVRQVNPDFKGEYPRMQLWHGTKDVVLHYNNFAESIKQWTNVHKLSQVPSKTKDTSSEITYMCFGKKNSQCMVEAYRLKDVGHNLPLDEKTVIRFFELDNSKNMNTENTGKGFTG